MLHVIDEKDSVITLMDRNSSEVGAPVSSAVGVFSVPICLLAGYMAYYAFFIVKKPVLACNYRLKNFLEKHCPIVQDKYWPVAWCLEPITQTVISSLLGSHLNIQYEREKMNLGDGGIIMLDWVLNDWSSVSAAVRPTVIILPGLVGSSQESYARRLTQQSTLLGFRTVVFNYRGKGGADLQTSRTYCAANTDDLAAVVGHVKKRYHGSQLFAVGVSLGGIILINYLARTGKECQITAAMSISAAWNMFESTYSLERPINSFVFNKYLTKQLKDSISKHEHLFRDKCDLQQVFRSQTIRDFDESFTARMFGYDSHVSYYTDASIDYKLFDVQVPLLCLNAADDPFSPGDFIPVKEACRSDYVVIVVTSRGGHIAFLDGILIPRKTRYFQRMFSQFFDAVFKHYDDLAQQATSSVRGS